MTERLPWHIAPICNAAESLTRPLIVALMKSGHKDDVIEVVCMSLEKCADALGVEMSESQKVNVVHDMIEEYKYEAVEDLIFVLQNGRKGHYGKVFGKLNMIVISEWMRNHLEDKARAREAISVGMKKPEMPTFSSRDEYLEWCEEGMRNQSKAKRLMDEIEKRKKRLAGKDVKFEADVAKMKDERREKGL